MKRYPEEVWPVTVRLPVTAVAFAGTPPRPVTWNDQGNPFLNVPLRPLPVLVSSSRAGPSGTKSAPSGVPTVIT